MDEHKQAVLQKRIEKTMKAMERNKMKPFYAKERGRRCGLCRACCSRGRRLPAAAR